MKKSGMSKKAKQSEDKKDFEKPVVAKTAYDLQRLKLMKLMKNPEKPILLPERPKSKSSPTVPEFVRNVMGSSAGAGSGEFHVYRHLRRKEYSRQKFIQEKGRKENLDDEYHRKIEQNKLQAELTTARKRAKRLKRKQKQREAKRTKNGEGSEKNKMESEESHDEDDTSEEEIRSDQTVQKQDGSSEKSHQDDDFSCDFRNTRCESESSLQRKLSSEETRHPEELERDQRDPVETAEPLSRTGESGAVMEEFKGEEITSVGNSVNDTMDDDKPV